MMALFMPLIKDNVTCKMDHECLSFVLFYLSSSSKKYLSAICSTLTKSDTTPPIVLHGNICEQGCRTPTALKSS